MDRAPYMSRIDVPDTLRTRILVYVRDHEGTSISELARTLQHPIANIRDKLNVAARHGHVKEETKRLMWPSGQLVLIHAFTITEAGRQWIELAERGST